MTAVTESIFNGKSVIIPLADVQHIEQWDHHTVPGIRVVTKHTRWDREADDWANCIWISDPEAAEFRRAWCRYRSELEADTLADLSPHIDKDQIMAKFDGVVASLTSQDGERNG